MPIKDFFPIYVLFEHLLQIPVLLLLDHYLHFVWFEVGLKWYDRYLEHHVIICFHFFRLFLYKIYLNFG